MESNKEQIYNINLQQYIKEINETPTQKATELIKKLGKPELAIVVYDNVFDELIPYSVEMQWWQEVKKELDALSQPKEVQKSEESINLLRLRYESLLKGLNDLTNELYVYKVNKDFELTELKEKFESDFIDTKGFLMYRTNIEDVWHFFLPHLQKPVESEWISVEDRLPNNNKPILLYQKTKHTQFKQVIGAYCNGKFNSYETEFNDDLYKGYYNKVTHWMPLPKQPKQ